MEESDFDPEWPTEYTEEVEPENSEFHHETHEIHEKEEPDLGRANSGMMTHNTRNTRKNLAPEVRFRLSCI